MSGRTQTLVELIAEEIAIMGSTVTVRDGIPYSGILVVRPNGERLVFLAGDPVGAVELLERAEAQAERLGEMLLGDA